MIKRGQFFLIAALLIAGVTIGFGTIYNEAKIERQDANVYELTEELHSEIHQVYDSGIVAGASPEKIEKSIEDLVKYYKDQNPDSNFLIVYGDENSLKKIDTAQGTTPISLPGPGNGNSKLGVSGQSLDDTITSIEVEFEDEGKTSTIKKEFKIKKGYNFYFVVRKKVKNENVIISR